MQVSKTFKRIIFLELAIPVALLTLGIYHGLMQTVYRAGVLQQTSFVKLDYYQGLTLHGVINAIVLTTFFAVAQMWQFLPAEIYIPVGSEVDFYLTSKDVVHGFNIAEKNVNMMAIYGNLNKTTVRFDKPGVYNIVCHEYCGVGHQNMRAQVIVNFPEAK